MLAANSPYGIVPERKWWQTKNKCSKCTAHTCPFTAMQFHNFHAYFPLLSKIQIVEIYTGLIWTLVHKINLWNFFSIFLFSSRSDKNINYHFLSVCYNFLIPSFLIDCTHIEDWLRLCSKIKTTKWKNSIIQTSLGSNNVYSTKY